ncbi:MAG: methyltransferase domain-containing protein, partial [Desulfobulbaceae bacterium]|nr:methyltransferase domain-containing protein [Desulfobulbaceae bacterium]
MNNDQIKLHIINYYNSLAAWQPHKRDEHTAEQLTPLIRSSASSEPAESAARLFSGCGTPLAYAPMDGASKVVDLGCGAGREVFLAAAMVKERSVVVGIDVSPAMIECAMTAVSSFAQKDRSIIFRVADIERYPMPRNFADVVISNNTLHLCPDRMAAYRNIFRALKHDGTVVFSDIVQREHTDMTGRNYLPIEDDHISAMESLSFVEVEIVERHFFTPEQAILIGKHIFPPITEELLDSFSPATDIYAITLRAKR